MEKLVEYCDVAVKEGATLVYGGNQVDMPGLYMTPTVITDVYDHMYVAKEESFGPIMVVSKFAEGCVFDIELIYRSMLFIGDNACVFFHNWCCQALFVNTSCVVCETYHMLCFHIFI